jgi:hypothetical protein
VTWDDELFSWALSFVHTIRCLCPLCVIENGQCCEIQFLEYRESEGASPVINSRSSGIRRPFSVDLDRGTLMEEPLSSGDQFSCTLTAELCLPNGYRNQVERRVLLKVCPRTIEFSFEHSW